MPDLPRGVSAKMLMSKVRLLLWDTPRHPLVNKTIYWNQLEKLILKHNPQVELSFRELFGYRSESSIEYIMI